MPNVKINVRHLHGPSVEAEETVVAMTMDGLDQAASMSGRWHARWRSVMLSIGFNPATNGLAAAMPAGLTAASTTARLAGMVLGQAGCDARAGRTPGQYILPDLPRAAVLAAARISVATVDLTQKAEAQPIMVARLRQDLERLRGMAPDLLPLAQRAVGVVLVETAARLGLPWRWSSLYPGLALVGEGRRLAIFDGSTPLVSPQFGGTLGANKLGTKRYLAGFGLPVLADRTVHHADDAVAAAQAIGYPVAIKPIDASRGRGVSLDIRTPEAVRTAYQNAQGEGSAVMIEPYLDTPDFRILMVRDQVGMVIERIPPYVVGDGRSTVAELVATHNKALAEQTDDASRQFPVVVDDHVEETLARAGLSLASVPAAGDRVILRTNAILRTQGGSRVDVTPNLHPENAELFRRLMAVVGLTVCGVDFRAEAIERPWHEQRFGILEINSRPNMANYKGHPVFEVILRAVAPDAESVRLPTIVVLDPEPGGGPDLLRAGIARAGLSAAVAAADGLRLAGLPVQVGPGEAHGRMVQDPTLAVAVHWITPGQVVQSGLGVATIDIAYLPEAPADDEAAAVAGLIRSHARLVRPLPTDRAAAGEGVLADVAALAGRDG